MKHINEAPAVPSERSELIIPPELDALVLECLEKDPENRPGSAQEMSERIREITLDRPWSKNDARRWWETHRPG